MGPEQEKREARYWKLGPVLPFPSGEAVAQRGDAVGSGVPPSRVAALDPCASLLSIHAASQLVEREVGALQKAAQSPCRGLLLSLPPQCSPLLSDVPVFGILQALACGSTLWASYPACTPGVLGPGGLGMGGGRRTQLFQTKLGSP